MPSLRLRLDPVLTAEGTKDEPAHVGGFRVEFTTRGGGSTKAQRDSRVPATLELVGRFTSSLRDHPAPEEMSLGSLAGEIETVGSEPRVLFFCDATSIKGFGEAPDEESESEGEDDDESLPYFWPRQLDILLSDQFQGLEPLEGQTPRLSLPKKSGQYRFLEIVPKLSIAGGTESQPDQSDILDVLILPDEPPTYPFSL